MTRHSPDQIKHIVVLMLENRSYDNVLGGLYLSTSAPAGQSDLNGLSQPLSQYANVDPANPGGTDIFMAAASSTTVPVVDPGEYYIDMAQQIYGHPRGHLWMNKYPHDVGALGWMGGFTTNYVYSESGAPQDVMTYLTPAQVPVTAFLAQNFAVSDCWYGAAPLQTYPNRAFAHCGAPGSNGQNSHLNDMDYMSLANPIGFATVGLASVFAQLDSVYGTGKRPNWKVYFHDIANAMIIDYVHGLAASTSNVNVAPFDTSDWGADIPANLGASPPNFLQDVANKTLPKYSFIEPRYLGNYSTYGGAPNSNHPGVGNDPEGSNPYTLPTDVTNGEILLATIYNALYSSHYWDDTLLIVTYDEHGGLYDHMQPPSANPPGSSCPPATNGYPFNTMGPRVPALLVSKWVPPGTTFRPSGSWQFDHTTIIKTVWDYLELGTGSLTDRDSVAESLRPFVNLPEDQPNNPGTVPVPAPPGEG